MAIAARGLGLLVLAALAGAGAGMGACADEPPACPPGTRPAAGGCAAIDDCAGAPCVHGACVDGAGGYTCACADGYRGPTCADDVDECAAGTAGCAAGARCTNTDGGYTCACPPGTAGDGRTCAPCAAGSWGEGCAAACAPGHCVGPVTCDPIDGGGRACAACAPGHTGADCEGACDPTGCAGGAVTCAQDGGARVCTAGCPPGRWGPSCEASCAAGVCAGTATCDQQTGALLACDGCPAGAWGPTCAAACEAAACEGVVTCDQATGAAIACGACVPGAWGPTCAAACPAGACAGIVLCDQATGTALGCAACVPGRWGATCTEACAQGACAGAVTCDQATGAAIACGGCTAGAWGPTCAEACAQGACAGAVTCDRLTGAPIACGACAAGAWGPTCAEACAQGACVGAPTCDQATGAVIACGACEPGWFGPACGTDWWDDAWAWRTPLAIDVAAAPAGVDHVQVAVDVAPLCYGAPLPPILHAYHFDQAAGDGHLDSLDGHGGIAVLDHGGAFAPGAGDSRGLHLDELTHEWVDLPDVVPRTDTVTLTAWVKLDVPPAGEAGVLHAWGTAGVPGGEVFMLSVVAPARCQPFAGDGARFLARVHPVGQAAHAACSATAAQVGRWHFVALAYDRRYERLWIDGALERFHDHGGGFGTLAPASAVRLGVERGLTGFFHGVLDDVVVYDGVLDDTDVAALRAPLCRRDLGDLRFHDATTGALLPHWVESAHRVWVRVPVDATSHQLAVYHGNPAATSGGDGAATFELFDDFAAGVDPARWSAAGCPAGAVPVAAHGRARATAACDGLTSVAALADVPLAAAIDVHRAGPTDVACADVRLGWSAAGTSAALRLDGGGVDALAIGGGAACAGPIALPGDTFDLGTLTLARDAADSWHAGYQPVHGPGLAATTPGAAGDPGALRLAVGGAPDSPRDLDNLRVWVASATSAAVGLPCAIDGTCARYRWVDLGPRPEPVEIAATCTGTGSFTADCDAATLGRRVHLDGGEPSAVTLRPLAAGSSAVGVTVPGGLGADATHTTDLRTLTWRGRTGCSGLGTATVALAHLWECQRVP